MSDDAISTIVEHANRLSSPLFFVVLEYYGGAAGRVLSEATAFPHRDLAWDILFIAQWTDPAQTNIHRDWARSGEEVLRPFSANAHLLSALDVEAEDAINTAFGANLPRLAGITISSHGVKPTPLKITLGSLNGFAQIGVVGGWSTNLILRRLPACRDPLGILFCQALKLHSI